MVVDGEFVPPSDGEEANPAEDEGVDEDIGDAAEAMDITVEHTFDSSLMKLGR